MAICKPCRDHEHEGCTSVDCACGHGESTLVRPLTGGERHRYMLDQHPTSLMVKDAPDTARPPRVILQEQIDQARDIACQLYAAVQRTKEGLIRADSGLDKQIQVDPALHWLRGEEQPPGTWTPPTEH